MVSAWLLLIEAVIALLFIAWLLWLQAREREQLYNRIQAGSLQDYRIAEKPPPRGGNMVTAGLKKALRNEAGDL